MYPCRSSTLIVVQGYPPDASIMFIRNRPKRPIPSGLEVDVAEQNNSPSTTRTPG